MFFSLIAEYPVEACVEMCGRNHWISTPKSTIRERCNTCYENIDHLRRFLRIRNVSNIQYTTSNWIIFIPYISVSILISNGKLGYWFKICDVKISNNSISEIFEIGLSQHKHGCEGDNCTFSNFQTLWHWKFMYNIRSIYWMEMDLYHYIVLSILMLNNINQLKKDSE